MTYVYTRVLSYIKNGIDVTVVSKSAEDPYFYMGVNVITFNMFKKINLFRSDVVVIHAPSLKIIFSIYSNIKNSKLIIHFHGHELLWTVTNYPIPYLRDLKNCFEYILRVMYDPYKIIIWIILMYGINVHKYIFVSRNLYNRVYAYLPKKILDNKSIIINNPISSFFASENYIPNKSNKYLYIRKFVSTYMLDEVLCLAKNNPGSEFHFYGEGCFPGEYLKLKNIIVCGKFILQSELPSLLNNFQGVILPSKTDTQGVLACEIASFGIPLLVYETSAMHEFLSHCKNVVICKNLQEGFECLKKTNPANNIELKNSLDLNTISKKELSIYEG